MTRTVFLTLGAFITLVLTVVMFVTAGWDLPPVGNQQTGYRGTAMVQIYDLERVAAATNANQAPPPPWELNTDGPRASEIYENVPVLGHLSQDQFDRLMVAITDWVAPQEEGCIYCHEPTDFASDSVYTKIVSRHMLEMTQAINIDWSDHVGETAVTCFTCHRGQPVPNHIWFNEPATASAGSVGMFGYTGGQNTIAVGLTSMHTDPYSPLLNADGEIRVEGPTALPTGHTASIQATEQSYALMIHMSESLGVNCTFCHNTRAFHDWEQSTPQRMTAWHGIQMVRDINQTHLEPLQQLFPDNRLGPLGDVAKANCTTCHQGVGKPLLGAAMAIDFPSLLERPGE